jgi:hypothetical protein
MRRFSGEFPLLFGLKAQNFAEARQTREQAVVILRSTSDAITRCHWIHRSEVVPGDFDAPAGATPEQLETSSITSKQSDGELISANSTIWTVLGAPQ